LTTETVNLGAPGRAQTFLDPGESHNAG